MASTGKRVLWASALVAVLILAYAWLDGGERALRDIVIPVEAAGDGS